MRSIDLSTIRELELFSNMDDSKFETMMQAAFLQSFPARFEIISEGDTADFLHVVVEGCVELYAKSNGREATMSTVQPVRSFILAAVLMDAVYLMSARTLQRSKILMIPSENICGTFEVDEAFAKSIVIELSTCYRSAIKEYKDLKLRTAIERLANRLLQYHQVQGENGKIELLHGKKTLASLLGMTPENLSRAFNTLKQYGVEVDGSAIKLTDVNALKVLAKPNRLIDDNQS